MLNYDYSMKSKHPRIAYRKLLGLLLIILASCKFQSPEISNNSENADIVSLQSIGFSKSDNSWLTQDCITQVDNSKDDIYIILPYAVNAADLLKGVIITFTAKSTQTRVGMPDSQTATQISGDPWISGQTKLIFASPGATQPVRLLMNHPISGDLIVRDYIVHTKKNIRPKLLNSEITERSGTETAITLKFQIVDENDNPIPAPSQSTGTWLDEESLPIWYTESKITLLNYPPQYDPAENAFLLEIEPRIQGISEIFFPNRVFEDQDGNVTTDTSTHPQDESIEGTLIRVKYSPSALYLSHAGNDENTGLTPEEPVRTWKRAKEIAAEEGIENINVAASNEPYDVAGEGEIRYSGPGTPWFSITGGWQEHFSQQYDTAEQSGDPKTTFIDSQQVTDLTGSDPVTAVLSYKSTVEPPFTPVLTDVTIKVDSTSPSIDNSAALFVDGSSGTGAVKIILNNVDCQAFEGTGIYSNGMMVRKASVELRNSRITGGDVDSNSRAMLLSEIRQVTIEDSEITGGNGGSGNSYGIEIVDSQDGTVTIDNSMIASGVVDGGGTYGIKAGELGTLTILNETRIIGGQANNGGTSCGIEALEGGILNFEYSSIVAGFENWGVDPGADENTVYGLHIKNTQANLRHVWIHSAPCADISVPVIYDADTSASSSYLIATGNSFISGDANTAAGIIFNNDAGSTGTPWVFLQNSVLNVGQSLQEPAAGLHFKNSMTGYILNNVIHVKGNAANESAGIKFSSSTYIADTGLNISNNLIYSDDVANLYGIISNFDITENSFQNGAFQIHHNNFWDTDNTAASQASFYIKFRR